MKTIRIQPAGTKLLRSLVHVSLLFICFASFLFIPENINAQTTLPPVLLDQETIECLNNGDWNCGLDDLIPLYFERGGDSALGKYIVFCYRELTQTAVAESRLRDGAELLELAIEYDNSNGALYADLGQIYFQLSQYDAARKAFVQAAELESTNSFYFEMLGRISYLTGESDVAILHWRNALSLNPGNSALEQRLQKLERQHHSTQQGDVEVSHLFKITFDEGIDKEIYNEVWRLLRDAWYDIGIELDLWPKRQIPVLLLSQGKYSSLTDAPTWSGGVYEGQIKIPVAEFNAVKIGDTIYHEYLHALIYDTMANRCPWWLNEGLAQYFQQGHKYKDDQLRSAADALVDIQGFNLDSLPGNIETQSQAQLSYSLAYSATHFLIERFTVVTMRSMLSDMGGGMSFASALVENTGYSFQEFTALWLAK